MSEFEGFDVKHEITILLSELRVLQIDTKVSIDDDIMTMSSRPIFLSHPNCSTVLIKLSDHQSAFKNVLTALYLGHRGLLLKMASYHISVLSLKVGSKTATDDGLFFLAHLLHSDKVSFCDHIFSVIRRACVCKHFLQKTSTPKSLIGF